MYIGFCMKNFADLSGIFVKRASENQGVVLPAKFYGNKSQTNISKLVFVRTNRNKTNESNRMIECDVIYRDNKIVVVNPRLTDQFKDNTMAKTQLSNLVEIIEMENHFYTTSVYGYWTKYLFNAHKSPTTKDNGEFYTYVELDKLWQSLYFPHKSLESEEWISEAPWVKYCFKKTTIKVPDVISSVLLGMLEFSEKCNLGTIDDQTNAITERNLFLFQIVCILHSRYLNIQKKWGTGQTEHNAQKQITKSLGEFKNAMANLLQTQIELLSKPSKKHFKNIIKHLNITTNSTGNTEQELTQAIAAQSDYKTKIIDSGTSLNPFLEATEEEKKSGEGVVKKIAAVGAVVGGGVALNSIIKKKNNQQNPEQKKQPQKINKNTKQKRTSVNRRRWPGA